MLNWIGCDGISATIQGSNFGLIGFLILSYFTLLLCTQNDLPLKSFPKLEIK